MPHWKNVTQVWGATTGATLASALITTGNTYLIISLGTIASFPGCAIPAVGAVFTATGAGSGNGVVALQGAPYPRNADAGDTPPPVMGWLATGDTGALSAQNELDTVNDILSCATPDASHATIDHNCYALDGTNLNQVRGKREGFLAVLAKKYWHGRYGFMSKDCLGPSDTTAAAAPDQIKYLTKRMNASGSYTVNAQSQRANGIGGYWLSTFNWAVTFGFSWTVTVNRYTGIRTLSDYVYAYSLAGSYTGVMSTLDIPPNTQTFDAAAVVNFTGSAAAIGDVLTITPSDWKSHDTGIVNQTPVAGPISGLGPTDAVFVGMETFVSSIDGCNGLFVGDFWGGFLTSGGAGPASASPADWTTALNASGGADDGVGHSTSYVYSGGASLSSTGLAVNQTQVSTIHEVVSPGSDPNEYDAAQTNVVVSIQVGLSDPYTGSDCYADFLAAHEQWDMSYLELMDWRTDEMLALVACVMYDEIGPTQPVISDVPISGKMDDLTGAQVSGAWPQRAWIDPADYQWVSPTGSVTNFNTSGGNTLQTPVRQSRIISHTVPGADAHFWFDYLDFEMEEALDGLGMAWKFKQYGGFGQTPGLPPTAMRWLNKAEAQYAPFTEGTVHPPGNYPQAFWNQHDGKIIGAKFVMAVGTWPAVNFGRPCGPDKYAVDQTTVCCITPGSFSTAGGELSCQISNTGNVTGIAGGIVAGDYVILTDSANPLVSGTYQVHSIGSGAGPWTITFNSVTPDDALPTGFSFYPDTYQHTDGFDHLGRLRFPTAPGVCGRTAITTSYAAGVLTIITAGTPWLRPDPTTGTLLADLYGSTMTLLQSGAVLTRVNDTTFTTPASGASAAVWLTGYGVDWTKNDSTSKRTGLHLEWTFNARAMALATSSQPAWYGGDGVTPGSGIAGCTGLTLTPFTYAQNKCLAVVGIVPFYAPRINQFPTIGSMGPIIPRNAAIENFKNQVLFPFPDTVIFDDVYGAHWQSAVVLSMPDPFWQEPFKPNCDTDFTAWTMDNGNGQADDLPDVAYYAFRPLVEVLSAIPAGDSLPAGVTLFYDPAHSVIAPPHWPNGIPCDSGGEYINIESEWGDALRLCSTIASSGRFATSYAKFARGNC